MSPDDEPLPSTAPETAEEQRRELVVAAARYSGPLPPPEALRQYDDVLPGAADRIISMAERQAEHRHALEKRTIFGNVDAQTRGQWMGFILGLTAIIGGFTLIGLGHNALGITSVLAALTSLVTVFVIGRRRQQEERERKREVVGEPTQQSLSFEDEAA